jgi:hypothetical protein
MEGDWNAERRLRVSQQASEARRRQGRPRPIVEDDHDEAETEYYESAADPTYVAIERSRRRYRAMFRRRLRHRRDP